MVDTKYIVPGEDVCV